MKKKHTKQAEIQFKPTEFQLDLLVGKNSDDEGDLQFYPSRNCQLKAQTINAKTDKKSQS